MKIKILFSFLLIAATGFAQDDNIQRRTGISGISSATANATYLKLDCSNDPLTGSLTFSTDAKAFQTCLDMGGVCTKTYTVDYADIETLGAKQSGELTLDTWATYTADPVIVHSLMAWETTDFVLDGGKGGVILFQFRNAEDSTDAVYTAGCVDTADMLVVGADTVFPFNSWELNYDIQVDSCITTVRGATTLELFIDRGLGNLLNELDAGEIEITVAVSRSTAP